jgi:hypothetical protein
MPRAAPACRNCPRALDDTPFAQEPVRNLDHDRRDPMKNIEVETPPGMVLGIATSP